MTSSQGATQAPGHSSPSVAWGLQAVQAMLRRMLDSADDVLFELSERASSDDARRSYFDSMRLLRKSGTSIRQGFEDSLVPESSPPPTAAAENPLPPMALSLRNDDEVQEEIAVTNIVQRVEGSASQPLWELGLRIQNIPNGKGLRAAIQSLRPKEVTEVFRRALRPLDLQRDLRLILFKLFERQFLADARPLYAELNRQLQAEGYSEHAVMPRYTGARPGPAPGPAPAAVRAPDQPPGYAPTSNPPSAPARPSYALPPALLQALVHWQQPVGMGLPPGVADPHPGAMPLLGPDLSAAQSPAWVHPNYSIPQGLLQALELWRPPSGSSPAASVPVAAPAPPDSEPGAAAISPMTWTGAPQRLSLVNQLLGETERNWPPEEIEALRRLLQPIARIALSDNSFFSSTQHPARRLIRGLDTLAEGPEAERSPKLAQVEAELQRLQQQAPPPGQVEPLDGAVLQQFLASQRSPEDVTSARLTTARKLAHQQVKALGSGHDLPVGLAPFLSEIWLPLMSALSLRFGTETLEWQRAAELLKRLFGESRWVSGKPEAELVHAILEDVSDEMSLIGVPKKLVRRATDLLEKGLGQGKDPTRLLDLETLGARPAAAPDGPAATPERSRESADAMLGNLIDWRASLPVGAWFRVFDRASDRTLWMMADVFYPEASSLSFTGFDPEVRVSVRKRDFIEDLREGRAEAVNPTPAQTESLARLCAPTTATATAD